jgi:SNF2 family DNA or RNA helicase
MKPIAHLNGIAALPVGPLYPHQSDGVAFLLSKKRAILADDMGLGKTRQAIAALRVAAPGGVILDLPSFLEAQLAARDPDGRSGGAHRGCRPR